MEYPILISNINDFIFCPISIYFHNLYGDIKREIFQSDKQLLGSYAHESVDKKSYSTRKSVLQGVSVYCERYNLVGKIDVFDIKTGTLTERKRKINALYDGYIFQTYAQYFSLTEMGYSVKKIVIHSYIDNINYFVLLPSENSEMLSAFETIINNMNRFNALEYQPNNSSKCGNCIYSDLCDRSLV